MTLSRTLIAALAIATVAAPTALARPADVYPAAVQAPAQTQQQATHKASPALTAADVNVATAPTWPAHPQPITAPTATGDKPDAGIDPATIGLGMAGGLLSVGAIASIAGRRRRTQRQRATA